MTYVGGLENLNKHLATSRLRAGRVRDRQDGGRMSVKDRDTNGESAAASTSRHTDRLTLQGFVRGVTPSLAYGIYTLTNTGPTRWNAEPRD